MRGEAAVLGLIEDLILNARRSLHLAGPEAMLDTLEARAGRGVNISRAILKDQPSIAAEGQTPLLVARDSEAAVVAHLVESAPAEVHGVHTHNPVIVRLVEGYINLAAQHSMAQHSTGQKSTGQKTRA